MVRTTAATANSGRRKAVATTHTYRPDLEEEEETMNVDDDDYIHNEEEEDDDDDDGDDLLHHPTTESSDVLLLQALMELQNELRIKHDEVDVMQGTIQNLSHVIQTSDRHILHLQRHQEQLQFKLQMLTFVEHDAENDNDHYHHHTYREEIDDDDYHHINPDVPFRTESRSSSTNSSHSRSKIIHSSVKYDTSLHRPNHHSLLHQWDTYCDDNDDDDNDHHHPHSDTTTELSRQLRRSVSMPSLISVPSSSLSSPSSSSIPSRIPPPPPQPETWNFPSATRATRTVTTSHVRTSRNPRTRTPVSVDDGIDEEDNHDNVYHDDDDDDDENEDETTTSTTSKESSLTNQMNRRLNNAGREEEKKEDDLDVTTAPAIPLGTSGGGGGPTIVVGPSQAHFYNVILERDSYKTKYYKIMQELHLTQKKLYSAQYKLRTCNTLLELSYQNGDNSNINSSNNNNKSNKINHLKNRTPSGTVKGRKSQHPQKSSGGPDDPTKSKTTTLRRNSSSCTVPLEQKNPPLHPLTKDASQTPPPPSTSPPLTAALKLLRSTNDDSGILKKHVPNDPHSPPPQSQYVMERPKIPTLPWRRNYGIGGSQNTNRMEKDTSLLQVSECVSYISDDEMIHKHWNASSDKAADAIATDQYLNALLSCSSEDNQSNSNDDNGTKLPLSTCTAIDTDNNLLYHQQHSQHGTTVHNSIPNDDADRGAGGGRGSRTTMSTKQSTTSRVAESILFDI